MTEINAALSYSDLILAVAERLGVAYYGPDGDQVAQVPVDSYTLDKCKRYVQDGIRMFMADAPPNGWRWQRPLAEIDIWGSKGITMPFNTASPYIATSAHVTGTTHVYAQSDVFSASMVGQVIAVRETGVFTIAAVVGPTEATLTPGTDYSWAGSKSFAVQDPTGEGTMTGTYASSVTTITGPSGSFYPSTEGKTLFITDKAGGITLGHYVSDTTMTVDSDVSWVGSATYNLSSEGVYALPQNFGGEVAGEITYQAGTNLGVPLNWVGETEIRRLRENWNAVSGNPYYAATRRNNTDSRRWDLLIYPNPGGTYRVLFPYIVYFDKISDLSDMHPAGFAHDETVKAAALAQAELQGEDSLANQMQYYREIMLPNSYKIDARSSPRRLGYCGNTRESTVDVRNFRMFFRRPTVTIR